MDLVDILLADLIHLIEVLHLCALAKVLDISFVLSTAHTILLQVGGGVCHFQPTLGCRPGLRRFLDILLLRLIVLKHAILLLYFASLLYF